MKNNFEIDNLNHWFKLMIKACQKENISFKSMEYMNLIMKGATKKNFVIFDNSGGVVFDIWELDDPDKIEPFIESVGKHLVHGYVKKGKGFLTDHEKDHPNWRLNKYLNNKEVEDFKKKYKGFTFTFNESLRNVMLNSFFDFPKGNIKILDVDHNRYCTIEVDGKEIRSPFHMNDILKIVELSNEKV